MYRHTIQHFARLSRQKARLVSKTPLAFVVAAMMAGAYVGIGIILIFSVAATVDPAWQKLVMGVSFGIALTLVVFAGSELFTGHTMYMVFGILHRVVRWRDLITVWSASWLGNLLGSVFLACMFVAGGGGIVLGEGASLLYEVAEYKMHSPIIALIARATLCNWLVCLALWMAARTQSDATKAIVIFWCLFAFMACGFEHSVANMTLFSIALLGDHPDTLNAIGMGYNLLWVTIGNILGGSVFIALAYWFASTEHAPAQESSNDPLNPLTLTKP